MKRLRGVVIFSSILLAAMYLSNPTSDDFSRWIEGKLRERLDHGEEENLLAGALGGVLSELGASLSKSLTREDNYYFFSLYTVDLGSQEYRYLGLFRTFVPLQEDNPLEPSNP